MQLKYGKQGGVLRVALSGELDQHAAAPLREKLDALIAEGADRIEFDMGGVNFMDSAGVGVILGRYRNIRRRGGSFCVSGAKGSVDKVLRMSGVYSLCTERGGK